jgi:hypothetical protein
LFLDFNDVVARGERMIRKKGLEGVIQLASFHPDYCFADANEDDVTNNSNRSPIRPPSAARRRASTRRCARFPTPRRSMGQHGELAQAGSAGWAALDVGPAR